MIDYNCAIWLVGKPCDSNRDWIRHNLIHATECLGIVDNVDEHFARDTVYLTCDFEIADIIEAKGLRSMMIPEIEDTENAILQVKRAAWLINELDALRVDTYLIRLPNFGSMTELELTVSGAAHVPYLDSRTYRLMCPWKAHEAALKTISDSMEVRNDEC